MSRFGFGGAFYIAANYLLLAGEARWHLLYKLTAYDLAVIQALAPRLAKLIHP